MAGAKENIKSVGGLFEQLFKLADSHLSAPKTKKDASSQNPETQECSVKGNAIVCDGQTVPFRKDENGYTRLTFNEAEVVLVDSNAHRNVALLDEEECLITRSDIAVDQTVIAKPISSMNADIISKIKGVIGHLRPKDIGAMLLATQRIKREDLKPKSSDELTLLRHRTADSYGSRGMMVYNLMRSNILQHEIMHYLNLLKSLQKGDKNKICSLFLPYWDQILSDGYPTAYFMTHDTTQAVLFSEMDRRFLKPGIEYVRVFSRGAARNASTLLWSHRYADSHGLSINKTRKYMIGNTPAVRLQISKSKDAK